MASDSVVRTDGPVAKDKARGIYFFIPAYLPQNHKQYLWVSQDIMTKRKHKRRTWRKVRDGEAREEKQSAVTTEVQKGRHTQYMTCVRASSVLIPEIL